VTARTPSAVAAHPTARRSGSLLSAVTAALLLGGIALAAPAAAIDDPTKPDARVTHGPSCHPGGVVVEVTGGTVDYAVTLATTRTPGGENSAEVPAGGTVVLRSGTVAWGETIDGRLEYAAVDGSGTTFVDELEGYTFTRPSQEDCAAITAPAVAATVPPVVPAPGGGTTTPDDPVAEGAVAGDDGAAEGPGTPAPAKAELPGTAPSVALVEAAAAPAALTTRGSLAPLVLAAVALGAAAAGLASALGRSRRAVRPPTGSA
jgi:hypothetical protein